jgi:hypothetical protein
MRTDYFDPGMFNTPLPTYSETERTIEIVDTIWGKKIDDASNIQYQLSQEDVLKIIREAAPITNRSNLLLEFSARPPHIAKTKSVSFEMEHADEKDEIERPSPTGSGQTVENIESNGRLILDQMLLLLDYLSLKPMQQVTAKVNWLAVI